MNKRGIVISGAGIILITASFTVVFALFSDFDPVLGGEFLVHDLLDDMFDYVTDESVIYPGGSTSFSYSGRSVDAPLLWGLRITDFEGGDTARVTVSDASGGEIHSVRTGDPVVFDMLVIRSAESYAFEVENTGGRRIGVMMMFAEDPENSDLLNDSDSPVLRVVVPLAVSGLLLMAGAVALIAGAVVLVLDWKKEKSRSSYY